MNRKLQKQIKIYSGVAVATIASANTNAQIVYVDVNPDTLISAIQCDSILHVMFDLDGDLLSDIKFDLAYKNCGPWSGCTYEFVKAKPLNGALLKNDSCDATTAYSTYYAINPSRISKIDTIKGLGTWLPTKGGMAAFFNCYTSHGSNLRRYGCWQDFNGVDDFLAIDLKKNQLHYFGWIRIRILNHHSFILKSYAYQTIPNAPIIAGDTLNTSLGFNEMNTAFQLLQNNNLITIQSAMPVQNALIKVYDLLGQQVLSENFTGTSTEITIDKKGIYVVEVSSEKSVIRKKVYVY